MSNFYFCTSLTGGTGGLKAIDGSGLSDKDCAIVGGDGYGDFYELDADSAAAESSPNILTPTANAGDKRWIRKNRFTAYSVMAADANGYIAPVTISEQRLLGRVTGGSIASLTAAQVLSILLASTAAGDIPYFSAANTLARLAKGSANNTLYMNAAGTFPEWGSGFKIVQSTLTLNTGSTSVSVTGAGFKPSAAFLIGSVTGAQDRLTFGFATSSGSIANVCVSAYVSSGTTVWIPQGSYCGVFYYTSASNHRTLAVSSFDSDGITYTLGSDGSMAADSADLKWLFIR